MNDVELVRSAWAAFARGDIAAATAALASDVHWYGADDPGHEGGCHSRDEAIAFIERTLADGVTAELLDVRDAGDRLVAVIETHAPPEWEQPPGPHGEVITVHDGTITEMVVHPTVESALAAVGLGASA